MEGTLVEDINYLHRTEEMFNQLLPRQRRKSQALQMLGDNSEKMEYAPATKAVLATEHVPPGDSRKVMCPLHSGLLSSSQPH